MQLKRETLRKKLQKNTMTGPDFCEKYSLEMDKHLKTKALELLPETICLIATGGYGRAELCPYSDIDILFLVPKNSTKKLETAIEKILYHFWDTGVKAGYAVRNIDECMNVIANDPKAETSLLDARIIWGNKALFDDLSKNLASLINKTQTKAFIKSKLAERDKRHRQFGDTRYVLEPNIKDGKGGLRDFQTLFWITKHAYNATTPADLAKLGILSKRECTRFEKAHHFLTTVRCHLHDIANRPEERLHFDIQLELAERLGYTHRNNAKAVERFMKHYFLVTRDIGDMTRIVCSAIEEDAITQSKTIKPATQNFMGFAIQNNRLNFNKSQNIDKEPIEIIKFFRVAQKADYDIHPQALRTIARNLNLIDKAFINNPHANELFIKILTSRKNASLILKRMNESGVLERFIPEFRKIIALMQFDRYHTLTVDEHTLRAIETLHKLESGELRKQAPLASRIINKIENRPVLFVAMLLHDICKGQNEDHSSLGAELALSLCPRLGLNDQETRLVSWLIFDHLFMAEIAFKRDLEDPQTIEDFMFRIHGPERLKLLTVLTTADIIAVGPKTWTNWKSKLLEELYTLAQARFTGKHPLISTTSLTAIPHDLKDGETRIDISQDDSKHATIINIYTPDKKGLFATLSGALSAAGANIIEAKINTLDNGFAADTFTIQNLSATPITKEKCLNDIKKSIHRALEGNLDIQAAVKNLTYKTSKKDLAFEIPSDVIINNKSSKRFTVIETYGRDKPAMLYKLAHIISSHNCTIKSAKIITQGLKASDIFYVQGEKNNKIENDKEMKALKSDLKSFLNE